MCPSFLIARLTAIALIAICSVAKSQAQRSDASRHPLEGFTEPVRQIDVAVADPGRVIDVCVRRGMVVKSGELLLRLDTSILDANRRVAVAEAKATARISALEVQHQVQQTRLLNYQALIDDGQGSAEELLRAQADERVAKFNLLAALEARGKAELALEEIDVRIAARSVLSPIAGIVTEVNHDVGEFVNATQPEVVTVVDLSQLRATFYLRTADALRLKADHAIDLTVPETQQQIKARIEYVAATTEADSGRVRVDVLIDNSQGKYRSGLRCRLQLDSVSLSPVVLKRQPRPRLHSPISFRRTPRNSNETARPTTPLSRRSQQFESRLQESSRD